MFDESLLLKTNDTNNHGLFGGNGHGLPPIRDKTTIDAKTNESQKQDKASAEYRDTPKLSESFDWDKYKNYIIVGGVGLGALYIYSNMNKKGATLSIS